MAIKQGSGPDALALAIEAIGGAVRASMEESKEDRRRIEEMAGRLSVTEQTLRTIVGDNTGESGLLHEVKRGQDQLRDGLNDAREEFRRGISSLTSDLREIKITTKSAPETRDWMNKWIGVGAFVGVVATLLLGLAAMLEVVHYIELVITRMR